MKLHSVLLLLAVAGCKTSSDSDIQSLDNFSRSGSAALNANVCSGTNGKDFNLFWGEGATAKDRIQVDSPLKDQLKPAIQKSLSAVPDGLQDWFFDKGGRIIISTGASALCQAEASRKGDAAEAAEAYHSCWKMDGGKFPVIYINANPDISRKKFTAATTDQKVPNQESSDLEVLTLEMQHSIVRSFGYVFSEVLSRLTPKQNKSTEFEFADGDIEAQTDKELLAWKFIFDIREMVKSGSNPDEFLTFKGLIRDPKILDPNKSSYEDAWKAWYTQYKSYEGSTKKETQKTDEWAVKARIFQDQIYAEAFDSWYCNAETRTQLTEKKNFNSSGAFFAKNIVSELDDAFGQRTKTAASGADGKVAAREGEKAESKTEAVPQPADSGAAPEELTLEPEDPGATVTATGSQPAPNPFDDGTSSLSLTGWRYPILRGLFAVGGALAYPVRAVGNWAANRNERVEGTLIRGQPIRNTLRIINGGPVGWRAERWQQTGGFQPVQRLQRGCLVRRWRC